MKTAVILFNLGGPDSKESIKPFLFNFFMDKNIILLPLPLRYLIARSISKKRSSNEAGKSYALLGDKSPLLENSQKQAHALQERLGNDYKVFLSMRYWHPMADEVAQQVKNWNPDKIILLPLYPQFSTTTTRSSFQTWKSAVKKCGLDKPTEKICCYPFNKGFIQASADNVRAVYEQACKDGHENPRILFSAHGLPEMVIKDGDPYQWQCEESAKKIAAALGFENPDWSICYQSRVGRLKWIGPSTEEELERAAKDKRAVIVYPHAFTQEHVETLVEIEIEYREKAHELHVPGFYRVPTVSTHPAFIEGLADNILAVSNQIPLCPAGYRRCCRRDANV